MIAVASRSLRSSGGGGGGRPPHGHGYGHGYHRRGAGDGGPPPPKYVLVDDVTLFRQEDDGTFGPFLSPIHKTVTMLRVDTPDPGNKLKVGDLIFATTCDGTTVTLPEDPVRDVGRCKKSVTMKVLRQQ